MLLQIKVFKSNRPLKNTFVWFCFTLTQSNPFPGGHPTCLYCTTYSFTLSKGWEGRSQDTVRFTSLIMMFMASLLSSLPRHKTNALLVLFTHWKYMIVKLFKHHFTERTEPLKQELQLWTIMVKLNSNLANVLNTPFNAYQTPLPYSVTLSQCSLSGDRQVTGDRWQHIHHQHKSSWRGSAFDQISVDYPCSYSWQAIPCFGRTRLEGCVAPWALKADTLNDDTSFREVLRWHLISSHNRSLSLFVNTAEPFL